MAFSPDYVRLVLEENFADARTLWLEPLLAIHRAHLVMLTEQGLVTPAVARAIRAAIANLDVSGLAASPYDPIDEDLYFRVDRMLAASCGPAVSGQLHTARSRNDIDLTMYRLRVRDALLDLAEAVVGLRARLATMASAHRSTLFPAHTHGQPAQPTTVAHYLLAVVATLERDTHRLLAAYETANRCPLGACAITGTGFAIDRVRVSDLLGFSEPVSNTYDAIASVDFLLEGAAAASTLLVGLGRVLADLLFWATAEVGYLRLGDGFVQISSIMPQKRNPVALEHARALASRGVGELGALAMAVHNTPFGDTVDAEDDLQPLVASGFRVASRAVALVSAALGDAQLDVTRMRARAAAGWVTATELADTLVRDHHVPFGTAHAITSAFVRERQGADEASSPAATLVRLAEAAGHPVVVDDDGLERLLSPEHFVLVRRRAGEPAPEATAVALTGADAEMVRDRARVTAARDALARARVQLTTAFDRL